MCAQKLLLTVPFFIAGSMAGLFAQTAFVSSGGDTSGPGGTVAYSIGQVGYIHFTGETGSVNAGVQQPYNIIMVSTAEPEIALAASIFPNPTATAIQLKLDEVVFTSGPDLFAYWLYDLQGRLLQNDDIRASSTIVTMEKLAGSVYFLRITRNNEEVKTFKIFKTN